MWDRVTRPEAGVVHQRAHVVVTIVSPARRLADPHPFTGDGAVVGEDLPRLGQRRVGVRDDVVGDGDLVSRIRVPSVRSKATSSPKAA